MMQRKRKVKKKEIAPEGFQIPQACLNQLNEFTQSFVLFSYNEYGVPQVYASCDTPMAANALQNHVKTWLSAVENLNGQIAMQNIIQASQE